MEEDMSALELLLPSDGGMDVKSATMQTICMYRWHRSFGGELLFASPTNRRTADLLREQ